MGIGHGLASAYELRAFSVKRTANRARVSPFPCRWPSSVLCSCSFCCPCLTSSQDCERTCRLKLRHPRSLLHRRWIFLPLWYRASYTRVLLHLRFSQRPRLRWFGPLGTMVLQFQPMVLKVLVRAREKVRDMAPGMVQEATAGMRNKPGPAIPQHT